MSMLSRGTVVSKRAAAAWTEQTFEPRCAPVLRDALASSPASPPDLDETLELIRCTARRLHA